MNADTNPIDPAVIAQFGGAPLVDSHVNLHAESFAQDGDTVINNALRSGVRGMLTISDMIASTDVIRRISKKHDFIWRSVGAHPHYAVDHADLTVQLLVDLAEDDDVVGIGECGLDFHYNHSPREDQMTVFRKHIEAAQETALPLIIHTREADHDMETMITDAMRTAPFTPLLHCYTSGMRLAEAVLEMGGFISFSGIITFKNAEDVRKIVQMAPLDRIIIETDCPYLAPIPKRGRRCEPAHLVHVAQKLSEIKGLSPNETAVLTTNNFFNLFQRALVDHLADSAAVAIDIADGQL